MQYSRLLVSAMTQSAIRCFLILIFGHALLATAVRAENPPAPKAWTASAAVAQAIAANPDTVIAGKRIETAQAAFQLAKAAELPTLNLSGEYGQTTTPMYSFGNILNQGAFDNTINFNDPGRTDNLQARATLLHTLYNGGRRQAEQETAAAGSLVARHDLTLGHHQLGFETVKAFHAIAQAEKMVDVREQEVEAILSALEVGKARYDAGDLLRQDLLNLELQHARAGENLIHGRHQLQLGQRIFLNLLGLPPQDVKLAADSGSRQSLPERLDYRERPELQRLMALIEGAAAELRAAEAGRLPTLDAYAAYQVDNGFIEEESGDSWQAGVRLNHTLFDGDRTQSRIAMARHKLGELQASQRKAEMAFDLELQQAELDYRQAQERLDVTSKMVDVALEVVRLSRARFKEGVILASEMIDLEMRLTDARARQLSAVASYQVAIANLRRTSGLPQFPNPAE